jgi:hypothetical protein
MFAQFDCAAAIVKLCAVNFCDESAIASRLQITAPVRPRG